MTSPRSVPWLLALLAVLVAGLVFAFLRTESVPAAVATAGAATPAAPAELTAKAPSLAAVREPAPRAPQSSPDPARVAPAGAQDRAAARDPELEAAHWVSGRVVFSPGVPTDERVEVEAEGREFEHRELHRVPVEADGSFRVAFSEQTTKGRVRVHARYLYAAETERFSVREQTAPLAPIELALGGRVEGVVLPPVGFETSALVGERIHLSRMRSETFSTAKLDEELHFEFGGVAPGGGYELDLRPEGVEAASLEGLAVEAGAALSLELALRRGVHLTGFVRAEDGEPLEGVSLTAFVSDAGRSSSAESQADGSFDLRGVSPGAIELRASRDGLLDAELELGQRADGERVEGLELTLERGATVSGTVAWPDGSPAEGVRVNLSPGPDGGFVGFWIGEPNAKTDAAGAFSISGLPVGPFELTARGQLPVEPIEGESRIDRRKRERAAPELRAELSGSAPAVGLSIVLGSGEALRLRVTDERGLPVESFRVRAWPADSYAMDQRAISRKVEAPDGQVALEGLGAGVWTLSVSALGFADVAERTVELPAGGVVQVELPRAPALTGRVIGPDGSELAERARVSLVSLAPELEQDDFDFGSTLGTRSAATDRKGAFELSGLVGHVRVVASADGWADSAPLELELGPAEVRAGLLLRLRRGGRIEGELRSPERAGRAIRITSLTGAGSIRWGGEPDATTDADGRFACGALTPGGYEVSVAPADGGFGEVDAETVTVEDERTTSVVLEDARIVVAGRVLRSGEAVAGASVSARNSEGYSSHEHETDAAGRFELTVPRAGSYDLSVQHRGVGGKRHEFEVSERGLRDLVVELGGATLSGVVLTAGVPVEGAWVSAAGHGVWTQTDAEGRFRLGPLEDGPLVVMAHAPGNELAPAHLAGVEIVGGASVEGLVLELQRAGTVVGTVRAANGSLAAGAEVAVFSSGTGSSLSTWSGPSVEADARGEYVLAGVAPGAGEVSARTTDGYAERAVEVRAGEVVRVDLTLAAGAVLIVTVRDAGALVELGYVTIMDSDGRDHARLDAGVEWARSPSGLESRFGPLPPGRYTVSAVLADGETLSREVDLGGEGELRVELARD